MQGSIQIRQKIIDLSAIGLKQKSEDNSYKKYHPINTKSLEWHFQFCNFKIYF